MTLNTPMGVGWPGMPVEIAPCATGTPLLNSVTRWVPIETTICCTPFFAAPNPSFSGLGFFAASLVLAALRTAASAGWLSPATRTKATLDRSAARSAMFPGRLQADIAAFLLLLRQRPRKNPPLDLPGEHITETRVQREVACPRRGPHGTIAIAFVAPARPSVHKEATIAGGVKGPSLLLKLPAFMGEPSANLNIIARSRPSKLVNIQS